MHLCVFAYHNFVCCLFHSFFFRCATFSRIYHFCLLSSRPAGIFKRFLIHTSRSCYSLFYFFVSLWCEVNKFMFTIIAWMSFDIIDHRGVGEIHNSESNQLNGRLCSIPSNDFSTFIPSRNTNYDCDNDFHRQLTFQVSNYNLLINLVTLRQQVHTAPERETHRLTLQRCSKLFQTKSWMMSRQSKQLKCCPSPSSRKRKFSNGGWRIKSTTFVP